jgi:ceramide glucosyltransferase
MTAVLAGVLGLLAIAGLGLEVLFLLCIRHVRGRVAPETNHRPPVSILRPVCGLDEEFEQNLSSLCELSYPRYEIIVIAADPNDAALPVVNRVARRYASIPLRVVVGGEKLGRNPKVSNLIHGSEVARYQWLLISDSNVHAHRQYLGRLVDEAALPEVGMVANHVVSVGGETLGAHLENLQLGGYLLPATAAAAVLRNVPCVMGKSMLFRRTDLEKVGGFRSVVDHLAEDHLLARAFHRSGRQVVISSDLLCTVNRTSSVSKFFSRHLRWNQIRHRISPRSYIFEGLAAPSLPVVGMGIVGVASGSVSLCAASVFLLAMRVLLHATLAKSVGYVLPVGFAYPGLVVLRDAFAFLIWLVAPLIATVSWRGRRYRLGPDTRIYPAAKRSRSDEVLQPEAA